MTQYQAVYSYATKILSLLVCLASFISYHMLTFIRFTIALLDCVRYNEDFVKQRFCSIHFTVILARLKKIVRYTEDFVI